VDSEELVISRRLRILHITKRFWPNTGGVERYVEDLARQQQLRGHAPRILTPDRDLVMGSGGRLPRTEYYRGLQIERAPAVGNARKQVPVGRLGMIMQALRWADVVHHHDPRFLFETTLLARRVMRFRLLFHTHGLILHTDAYLRLKRILLAGYYGPALRHLVDAVVADSEGDLELLRQTTGVYTPHVRVVPNAVDLAPLLALEPHPEPGMLLAFGRIDYHKGIEGLLRSLRAVPGDWRLVIAGNGPVALVGQLKTLARDIGIAERVTWAGFVSDDDLRGLLQRSSLVLFPSKFEGFGIALLEAMAASRPVLASPLPTHVEILGPELGRMLSSFDAGAAHAIVGLLKASDAEREELGRAARLRARTFELPRMVDALEQIYREVGVVVG
jgi:glycosyltransferase involved in cell wall biosynthesis